MKGFETILKTTNRKERKELLDNERHKDLRGSAKKRDESVDPATERDLSGFRGDNHSRVPPKVGRR